MDAELLLSRQRELRAELLDRSQVSWLPARDLAAHLLLYLDDDTSCWDLSVRWLQHVLDADRVDAGFALPREPAYRARAEALRATRCVPSVINVAFDAADPGLQRVWKSLRLSVFADVGQERSFGPTLRHGLSTVGTRSKLAAPLWHRGVPVGLACADWMEPRIESSDSRCSRFQDVATQVLGPIMAAVKSLKASDEDEKGDVLAGTGTVDPLAYGLTPAERKVALLAATGMSYKEIARQLGRSFSTVDHQLRSVRMKLGARSTGRLVRLLADQINLPGQSVPPQAANGS